MLIEQTPTDFCNSQNECHHGASFDFHRTVAFGGPNVGILQSDAHRITAKDRFDVFCATPVQLCRRMRQFR